MVGERTEFMAVKLTWKNGSLLGEERDNLIKSSAKSAKKLRTVQFD
jgi:hypothetical protein